MNMVDDPSVPNELIPKAEQISKKRGRTLADINKNLPGESPAELKEYVRTLIRNDSAKPWDLWVDWNNVTITAKKTIIPITSDELLNKVAKFIVKGVPIFKKKNFLNIVGDFTHNQTRGGLKKGLIGPLGIHYHHNEWKCTLLPGMYIICHAETEEVLRALVRSWKECMIRIVGLDIVPFIGEWFWDGKVEADTVFGEELDADANGHACLQHGKKNTKTRCSGGYKQAVSIMLDMFAFLPPFPFHIALKIFLAELENVGQVSAVKYLKGDIRTPSPFSLIKDENGLWSARWKSSFKEVQKFISAYSSNTKESDW